MGTVKEALVATSVGSLALAVRDRLGAVHAALTQLEGVGCLANDQLATHLVTRLCRGGKAFIDVGAHIGSVLAEVRRADASVVLIAIEPIPEKAANLRSRFPFVQVHECAAGEEKGRVTFFVHLEQSGYSSLIRPSDSPDSGVREITVSTDTVDHVVEDAATVDVMKIDVEGAELGVLRGARTVLERARPIVMFESAPSEGSSLGYTKEGMHQFFGELKYQLLVPNRVAHDGPGLSQEGFVESHHYPRRTTNYFAVPEERRIEVRDRARRILGVNG